MAYSSLDQESREMNLEHFRTKKTRVLIVTDVAARGLDIPLLDNVINFDFPATKEGKLFIHRVGRTARQGRNGTAFSLVTLEEIPCLLDLFLFLGVKLLPQNNTTYSIEDMQPSDVHFGRFPREILADYSERVEKLRKNDSEIGSLEKSVKNAYTLYKKTREKPSRASIKRMKQAIMNTNSNVDATKNQSEYDFDQIHPLFRNQETSKFKENSVANLLRQYKIYRPKETIFEITEKKNKKQKTQAFDKLGGKSVASKNQLMMNGASSSGAVASIKEMRENLNFLKQIKKTTAAQTKNSSRPDEVDSDEKAPEFGIEREQSSVALENMEPLVRKRKAPISKAERKMLRKGYTVEDLKKQRDLRRSKSLNDTPEKSDRTSFALLENSGAGEIGALGVNLTEIAGLDLVPDEGTTLNSRQRNYLWDKRKKRYIKATKEEHIQSKRLRNESGTKINVKNRGSIYKKWQRKSRKRIQQLDGVDDDDTSSRLEEDSVSVRRIAHHLREKEKREKQEQKILNESKSERSVNSNPPDEATVRKRINRAEKMKEKNMKGRKKILKRKKRDKEEEEAKLKQWANKKRKPSTNRFARSRIIVKK